MKSTELKIGRTFFVALEDGDQFFPSIERFCKENNIMSGYIPGFIAGFRNVKIVGTVDEVADPSAPVWNHVHLEYVEAIGTGTIAFDEAGIFSPHIHVSVGRKLSGSNAYTSHLLSGEIIFISEMTIVEVIAPTLVRAKENLVYPTIVW